MSPRSTLVVVATAAAVGSMMAPFARAVTDGQGSTPPPSSPPPASPAGPTASTKEDVEPDDSHAAGDNPYDESPAPARRAAPVPRQVVTLKDGMLHLPGGRFVMGSSNPRSPANERPARPLVLPAFWIDRTEVTVGAYRGCVDAGRCARPAKASATCTFDAGDPDLPVSCVHWRDADAYCHFAGKRLPNEREWEYAARGTMAIPFPWGTKASCTNALTLINDQSGLTCARRPAPVGTHPSGASVFGVHDMSGNLEEWTADWYAESLGPSAAPRAGAAYVLRGGGWLSPPSMSRTTSRNWGSALEAGANVGFRCARDD
jgi:formylglycine-generating enzyme required for sulfatase activity